MAGRIRIALAALPPLLRDIVRDAVRAQPDMEVVAESGRAELAAALRDGGGAAEPDVVLLGVSRADDERTCAATLLAPPERRILTIETSGRAAAVYELRLERTPLGELSPAGLVDAIRAGARRRAPPAP